MTDEEQPLPRFPLLRVMVTNATLLSVIYLSAAVFIEAIRRWFNPRWSEAASHAMEKLPARALELTGLLRVLRYSYIHGGLSELGLRVVFGAATVAVIFAMAFAVGLVLWAVRALWERHGVRP